MRRSALHRTASIATWATLALISFGGYTRGSGSGYGCKDRWPLCEGGAAGGFLPRLEPQMIVEWTHRWIALVVGVVAIVLVVGAIRGKHDRVWVVTPAVAAVVVIGIQSWLGRMVVKGDLDRDLVSVHLGVSMVVVALFVVVAVATRVSPASRVVTPGWRTLVGVGALSVYAVMMFGSIVHNLYFPGWPLPGGSVVPDSSSTASLVHYFHRFLAGSTGVLLVVIVWLARRHARPSVERTLVDVALVAFLVNAALGAVHVFTQVQSSFVVAAHIGFAGVVWAALVAALVATFVPEDEIRSTRIS